MTSVFLDLRSNSTSTDEPIEHEENVACSVYVGERKAEVKCRPSSGIFHNQVTRTQEAFEDLITSVIASTTVIDNNLAQLTSKEERLIELSTKISSINFESAITLNVGGFIYQTTLETLTRYPGSLLAEMFSERYNLKQGKDGSYFIDRDGRHFRHILSYLRSGTAPVLSIMNTDAIEVLCEADYYGLVGLVKAIKNKLNGHDKASNENVQEEHKIPVRDLVDEARKEILETGKKLNLFQNLLDANMKAFDRAACHHKKISMKLSNVHFGENVKIDVGGRIFKTSLKTLRRESDSVLALMFSEKYDLKKEDDGSFFIDRDGTLFHHILNYLRDGKLSEDAIEEYGPQILREAEFYGLSGLKKQIHNYYHVKLNVGGEDFIATREVLKKYPESIFSRIASGEDCTFKRRQDGSFYIHRDATSFMYILNYLRSGILSDDIIEKHGALLIDDAEFYMLPCLRERINNYYNVKMIIGCRDFVVNRELLSKFQGSLFDKMLKGERGMYVKGNDGSYVIQHDAANIHHILSYLKSGALNDGVIEKHGASLLCDAEFFMLPCLRECINNYHNVKMIIGGKDFIVPREVLTKFPFSLFGKMLKGEEGDYVKRTDGSYVIQFDATNFKHILTYLRSGTLSDDVVKKDGTLLLDDAEFYLLPGLMQRINNYHNVKMIIGGNQFVVRREVLSKFQGSLFDKMLKGERGNYMKRYHGSYIIERDATNFNHILTFLRSGTLSLEIVQKHFALLLDDAEFFMLHGLTRWINGIKDKVRAKYEVA